MPTLVSCPDCQVNLRVPDQHLGKAIRCPKCRGVIETQAPESQAAEGVVAALPPEPVLPRAPVAPRRKKRLKKKYEPRFPVRTAVGLGIGGFFMLVVGIFVFWFVRYGTHFRMAGIPEEKWETLEIPHRLKVRLPGPAQKNSQDIA